MLGGLKHLHPGGCGYAFEKKKEFQMNNRQQTWMWLSAAVCCIVGIILVLNDSAAGGGFLIILGIGYLATLTRPGQTWAKSNPSLIRWGSILIPVLLVILVVVAGAVLLLK